MFKNTKAKTTSLVVLLVSVFLLSAFAGVQFVGKVSGAGPYDWPMYLHDLQHTGTSASPAPNTNQTLWTYTTGDVVESSPAVADGKIYVGSYDAKVYCLDAATGALVWNYTTGGAVLSSPAVADSKVYIGSFDKNVYCLNALTGALMWNYTTGSGIYSSPAVADGKVYVGSDDSKVYCLNAANGALVWNYTSRGGVGSSPAVADGKVYVGSKDFSFYCLNAANGALVWNYTTGGGASSSPVVSEGKVYVASMDRKVYCLDAATGASIWNYTTGARIWTSSPTVANGKVYVGSGDRNVYCLNAANGALVWNYTTGGPVYGSSPAVADGKVYVGSYDNGKVYCLDAATGALKWNYRTDTPPGSWGVWSSPSVANGVVYVGSDDKSVYAFGATARYDWSLVQDARALKAYPNLKEYVWEKNASRAPNGQYDKIGLHRLVNPNTTPKGVILMTNCPTWGTGEERISNPPSDNWTKYENFSQAIYLANRGYDVYAIDYRTQFVPRNLNASQTGFMANWGWDVWVSDIKEAADKVKEVSGASKFFISGECSGGEAALNYATKYQSDLRGIILFDMNFLGVTAYPVVGTKNTTNTFNLTTALANMNAAKNWTRDDFPQSFNNYAMYALQNPGAPAVTVNGTPPTLAINPLTNKTWSNITEYFAFMVQYLQPAIPGMYSNVLGGYGNIAQVEYCFTNTGFIPLRLYAENSAMANWVNCPYMTYDYNDHYKEINVPVLAFESSLFGNRAGPFQFVNGMATFDFTGIMLPNYGHMDVFIGTYSARDVSEPALQWMLDRSFTPTMDQAALINTAKTVNQGSGNSQTSFARGSPVKITFNLGTTTGSGKTILRITFQQPDLSVLNIVSTTAYVDTNPSAIPYTQLIPSSAQSGTWTATIQIFAADGVTPLAVKGLAFTVT